jgi:hypothetical protein
MRIEIDESVWTKWPEGSDRGAETWHDGNGVALSFNAIGFDRDLYPKLADELSVREYYRDMFAANDMGIVECNVLEKNGTKLVKVIAKKVAQHEPARYIGSIAIPLSDRSFVFSLIAEESGITGYREAIVFAKLSKDDRTIELDSEAGLIHGWNQDPYFPEYQGPCLRNLAEDEKYDHEFPDHPLTKVRFRASELVEFVTRPSKSVH